MKARYWVWDATGKPQEVQHPHLTGKRLTDAELAAEYHAAHKLCWSAIAKSQFMGEGAHSDADAEQWAEVVSRFATRPHYDEED